MGQTKQIRVLGAGALCVLFAVGAIAQVTRPTAPPPTTAKKKRLIYTDGDYYRQEQTAQGTIRTLRGNVKIRSEETVLTTDLATYNEQTGVATSPGKLKVEDPDNTLIGNTGTAFYKTRDVKIRDAVTIVIKPRRKNQNAPESSSRRNFKDPVNITCTKLDYNWRTKIADMTGDLTFKQATKDLTRTVTADRAIYDGNTETLTLIDNVVYTTNRNERGKARKAIAVLKEGQEEFTVIKPHDTVIEIEDEEEGASPNPTPNPGTPGARPGNAPIPPATLPADPGTTPPAQPATTPPTTPQPATPSTNPAPALPGGTP